MFYPAFSRAALRATAVQPRRVSSVPLARTQTALYNKKARVGGPKTPPGENAVDRAKRQVEVVEEALYASPDFMFSARNWTDQGAGFTQAELSAISTVYQGTLLEILGVTNPLSVALALFDENMLLYQNRQQTTSRKEEVAQVPSAGSIDMQNLSLQSIGAPGVETVSPIITEPSTKKGGNKTEAPITEAPSQETQEDIFFITLDDPPPSKPPKIEEGVHDMIELTLDQPPNIAQESQEGEVEKKSTPLVDDPDTKIAAEFLAPKKPAKKPERPAAKASHVPDSTLLQIKPAAKPKQQAVIKAPAEIKVDVSRETSTPAVIPKGAETNKGITTTQALDSKSSGGGDVGKEFGKRSNLDSKPVLIGDKAKQTGDSSKDEKNTARASVAKKVKDKADNTEVSSGLVVEGSEANTKHSKSKAANQEYNYNNLFYTGLLIVGLIAAAATVIVCAMYFSDDFSTNFQQISTKAQKSISELVSKFDIPTPNFK